VPHHHRCLRLLLANTFVVFCGLKYILLVGKFFSSPFPSCGYRIAARVSHDFAAKKLHSQSQVRSSQSADPLAIAITITHSPSARQLQLQFGICTHIREPPASPSHPRLPPEFGIIYTERSGRLGIAWPDMSAELLFAFATFDSSCLWLSQMAVILLSLRAVDKVVPTPSGLNFSTSVGFVATLYSTLWLVNQIYKSSYIKL